MVHGIVRGHTRRTYDTVWDSLADIAGSVVVGHGLDEQTAIGRLQNADQREIVAGMA